MFLFFHITTWNLNQPTFQKDKKQSTLQVLIRRSYRAFGVSKDSVIRIERKEARWMWKRLGWKGQVPMECVGPREEKWILW